MQIHTHASMKPLLDLKEHSEIMARYTDHVLRCLTGKPETDNDNVREAYAIIRDWQAVVNDICQKLEQSLK